ncbi:Gfo/Idh/MocA family protein [Pseudopedobacter beijingensis]|uniref:Gfo/Idh/MocA family protein n=1 Tax=Pseudopedobacter beijingensis TaxID=1207056 RepID=A0ABW4IIB8_9SPHI
MSKTNITRRKFISGGTTALGVLSLTGVPNIVFGRSEKIRLGLIGCGQRGGGISSIVSKLDNVEIVAFCDVSKDALHAVKKYAIKDAKYYENYHELLQDKKIDGVIIATPLYLHYQMCVDSLDAKKHVYVEKTMTYSISEAVALVNKVKSTNLVLQVGHQYRYFQMYYKIKEIIDQGWLGQITHFESQYNRNSDWRRPLKPGQEDRIVNWRMYKEYSGGVLAELCAHQIDIVNWMVDGHPNKVIGLGDVNYWKDGRETYDNVRTIYEYDNGVKSSVTSVLSNEYNSYAMRILGSKATIDIRREKAFLYPEPKTKTLGVVDGVTGATVESIKPGEGKEIVYKSIDGLNLDPTAYSLMAFADCIKNNQKPVSNVNTGKDVAIAVHMGNQAVESGVMQHWDKNKY